MFAFFEQRVRPTVVPKKSPPPELLAFYWHFVSQTKGLYGALFATGLAVALIDTLIPVFIGRLVEVMEATARVAALRDATAGVGRQAARYPDRQPRTTQCGGARSNQYDPVAKPLARHPAELVALPE